jgi:hypothetical protein
MELHNRMAAMRRASHNQTFSGVPDGSGAVLITVAESRRSEGPPRVKADIRWYNHSRWIEHHFEVQQSAFRDGLHRPLRLLTWGARRSLPAATSGTHSLSCR